ncbi:diacylglycerol kinase family protein [bacterium]|nr:diacylglycerol kinase family protein [bacterium]
MDRKRTQIQSFRDAFRGIGFAFYSQRNMRVHAVCAVFSILLAWYLDFNLTEWMILFLTITSVVVTETLNTSIEVVVDLVTRKRKFRAMIGKDVAAGAVLIACINAIIIGGILFIPKIGRLIFS